MKTTIIKKTVLALVAALTMTTAMAQRQQATFKTNGYESKANIEAAAKKVGGVKSAEYTSSNKQVKVVYDKSKTTPTKIRQAVLQVDKKPTTKKAIIKKAATTKKTSTKKKSTKKSSSKRPVPQQPAEPRD